MTFHGGAGIWKPSEPKQTDADILIKACVDAGINFIDTATFTPKAKAKKFSASRSRISTSPAKT